MHLLLQIHFYGVFVLPCKVDSVCVWADCHFISGELSYDESHAKDGET